MTWRTVVISQRAKCELRLDRMVVRQLENIHTIPLAEIDCLIFESTQTSLTSALLAELAKRNINVLFCDEKHNPIGQYIALFGCHDVNKKIQIQINWKQEFKRTLWAEIIRQKINGQLRVLKKITNNSNAISHLECFLRDVKMDDSTNREGLAAKVYFHNLFGPHFYRDEDSNINSLLNYGYQVLLSYFTREIKANGYLTELGIHHNNQHNPFNLASDFMEPFRPIVDYIVLSLRGEDIKQGKREFICKWSNSTVDIANRRQNLKNSIKIYVNSLLKSLEYNTLEMARWPGNELQIYENNSSI